MSTARKTALITGASSGIGAAFAQHLAAEGYNLVLVARDSARLEQKAHDLATQHQISAEVLVADLASDAGCEAVEQRIQLSQRPIDLLINNAGLGLKSSFTEESVATEEHMLRLNVRAVMRLSHAFLTGPPHEKGEGILNVSSVASFGPVSPGSTYSATKAWVTNFSETLHIRLAKKGIRVMALCPGFVHTEFHARAGLPTGTGGAFWWLNAENVVSKALKDFRRGKAISVPTLRYRFLVWMLRHLPRSMVYAILARARR